MVRLNLTWRDRRLNYMNLRDDFYQNLVNLEEKKKLWLPTVGKDFVSSCRSRGSKVSTATC